MGVERIRNGKSRGRGGQRLNVFDLGASRGMAPRAIRGPNRRFAGGIEEHEKTDQPGHSALGECGPRARDHWRWGYSRIRTKAGSASKLCGGVLRRCTHTSDEFIHIIFEG